MLLLKHERLIDGERERGERGQEEEREGEGNGLHYLYQKLAGTTGPSMVT